MRPHLSIKDTYLLSACLSESHSNFELAAQTKLNYLKPGAVVSDGVTMVCKETAKQILCLG